MEARTDDPRYRPAVVDLLALLAYGELTAFQRLAEDMTLAPTLADKSALGEMAVAEFGHFRRLRDHLSALGVDPEQAMTPFAAAIDAFHERTRPSTWLESLVKAYVGDGIAADFYRTAAGLVDPEAGDLVREVLADAGQAEFVVGRVRAAVAADPKLAGPLALWARRLVGEALSQAYRVAAEREALAWLVVAGVTEEAAPGSELSEITRAFARLTDQHGKRMVALGLVS